MFTFFNGCKVLEPEPNTQKIVDRIIIIEDFHSLEISSDSANIDSVKISNFTLKIYVSYSGGCLEHGFQLYAENSFAESAIPQAYLYLAHDARGDNCEAFIHEALQFDLQPLTDRYIDLYRGSGPMILQIFPPESTEPAQPALYFEF